MMDLQQPETNQVLGSSLMVSMRRVTPKTSKETGRRRIQALARIKLNKGKKRRFDTQSSLSLELCSSQEQEKSL